MLQAYILIAAMAIVIAVAGSISAMIYRELEYSGDTAMTKMKLNADKTYGEFKLLMYGHGLQAIGLLIIGWGTAFGLGNIAIPIGRAFTVLQGIMTISVIIRWWKRFR